MYDEMIVAPMRQELTNLGIQETRSAAEVDPEAAELLDEIERGRTERMLHNARALEAGGHLRSDLSAAQAADLLLIFSGEFYDRLVVRAGWDVETYVAAMTRTMAAALLRRP